jgi:hypothetical protein
MVYLDAWFVEYAIEQFGAERFKPVFPGEHLYLGLRRQRVAVPQATHTMADIPGRRLRALVREKMEKLNAFVSQGAPMLPALSPMFVSRIVHDRARGTDLVPMLLEIRNSPAMTRFRRWMVRCWELSRGTDLAQREKAAKALGKLDEFSFEEDISVMEFGKALLDFGKDVLKGDPLAIIEEMAPHVMKYLAGIPLSGLRQFGKENADAGKLLRFFKTNFGDQFNRNDMNCIASFLQLPEDLTEWGREDAELATEGRRLDPNAPALSRPYDMRVGDAALVENAKRDFEELLERAEPVTREMLRKWEEESGGRQ